MRLKHSAVAVLLSLLFLGLSSCRNDLPNAKGKEAFAEVDWEEIHKERRSDTLGQKLCEHLFMEEVSLDSVQYFLGQGANPDYIFSYEESQRKLASYIPVVNWFIRNKNRNYTVTITPLNLAVSLRDLAVVDALLKAGADINADLVSSGRPIDEAVRQQDLKLVHQLKSRGADVTLANLVYADKISFIDSLVAMGADGSTINIDRYIMSEDYASLKHLLPYKKTLTEVSCSQLVSFVEPKMVLFLLDNGMSPNVTCREAGGGTLFMEACNRSNEELMKMLLKAGADPNVEDAFGRTALLMVAEEGDSNIANLMLKNHVNLHREPDKMNIVNDYPLESAIEQDNVQMVAWLIKHGVKMHKAVTPLDYATEHQAKKTAAWLRE